MSACLVLVQGRGAASLITFPRVIDRLRNEDHHPASKGASVCESPSFLLLRSKRIGACVDVSANAGLTIPNFLAGIPFAREREIWTNKAMFGTLGGYSIKSTLS